jgi:hypothetical protein
VQRKELGDRVEVGCMTALVDLADAQVQLAATPERQTFVGGVADQRVPESELAGGVRVALDEFGETIP